MDETIQEKLTAMERVMTMIICRIDALAEVQSRNHNQVMATLRKQDIAIKEKTENKENIHPLSRTSTLHEAHQAPPQPSAAKQLQWEMAARNRCISCAHGMHSNCINRREGNARMFGDSTIRVSLGSTLFHQSQGYEDPCNTVGQPYKKRAKVFDSNFLSNNGTRGLQDTSNGMNLYNNSSEGRQPSTSAPSTSAGPSRQLAPSMPRLQLSESEQSDMDE